MSEDLKTFEDFMQAAINEIHDILEDIAPAHDLTRLRNLLDEAERIQCRGEDGRA